MVEQLALPIPGLEPNHSRRSNARSDAIHPARTVTLTQSRHPAAIVAQARRDAGRKGAVTAAQREAERRRDHRIALEAAMEKARLDAPIAWEKR